MNRFKLKRNSDGGGGKQASTNQQGNNSKLFPVFSPIAIPALQTGKKADNPLIENCFVCGASLHLLSLNLRTGHVNKCLDQPKQSSFVSPSSSSSSSTISSLTKTETVSEECEVQIIVPSPRNPVQQQETFLSFTPEDHQSSPLPCFPSHPIEQPDGNEIIISIYLYIK